MEKFSAKITDQENKSGKSKFKRLDKKKQLET